jgi:osmotically-inducible protein OsmY
MAIPKVNLIQIHRTDEMILDDIWSALSKEETIRAIDIYDISVNVENGQACLSGHVSREFNEQRIEEIARSILGVMAVHNHIVADSDLTIQIVQALNNDKLTRPYSLPVYSHHGWVGIGGLVPNRTIQRAAEEIAARVPAVRGVVLLPDIEGEQCASVRDAVQPRIGVQVYGDDETEGKVYQVVILPQNRLVTHAIVRVNQLIDNWQRSCDYLVPIEAMNCADEGNIFLKQSAPAIHQFPAFNPADYPFAPLTWQPPYPYAIGSVRWPRPEQAKPEDKFQLTQ